MINYPRIYHYINKYIREHSTPKFYEDNVKALQTFLYMSVNGDWSKEVDMYEFTKDIFIDDQEFRDIATACIGNMKRVFSNDPQANLDYDKIYTIMTDNPKANLNYDCMCAMTRINDRIYPLDSRTFEDNLDK